ncbi:HNH endonuclease signature motif containing protein, partial [Nocardia spumae]
ESDRTCCVCRNKKPVQIHHIDDNPSNNDFGNLAVLCFDCHRETQIQGGFDRKLDSDQVALYRRHWLERVRAYRSGSSYAEGKPEERSDELKLREILAKLEVAREQEDWLAVARLYSQSGDEHLRDKYVERALENDPSPFYQVLIRNVQGIAEKLPEDVKDRAVEEVSDDWSTKAGVLAEVGRYKESAEVLLGGIREALIADNYFTAAYYIKNLLSNLADDLFILALKDFIRDDDLWWQLRVFEELGWEDEANELLLKNEHRIANSGDAVFQMKLASAKGDTEAYLAKVVEIEARGPAAWDTASQIDEEAEDGNAEEF